MTAAQAIENFLLEYDRVNSLSAPNYTDDEILTFINRAYKQVVADQVVARNYTLLDTLVATYTFGTLSTYTTLSNAYYVDITQTQPANGGTRFGYYISSSCTLSRSAVPVATSTKVTNEYIDRNQAKDFESNSVNSPIFRNPKVFIEGDDLVIIYDNYTTVTALNLVYVKIPYTLVTGSPGAGETGSLETREDLDQTIITTAVHLSEIVNNPEKAAADIQLDKQV